MSPGCTGIGCRQGRTPSACECELSSVHSPAKLELVRSVPSRPLIAVTGGRTPWRKRVRLFIRFLLSPNF